MVGDANAGTLAAIKRVTLGRKSKVRLEFAAPEEAGKAEYAVLHVRLVPWVRPGVRHRVRRQGGDGGGDSDMEEDE